MTIYWERCTLCGKYKPIAECQTKVGRVAVCHNCASIFNNMVSCPTHWYMGRNLEGEEKHKKTLKEIEDLLKMLE